MCRNISDRVNIMSNFGFLSSVKKYRQFADAAVDAEKVYAASPAMCVVACRKALELAIKWVYSADNDIRQPYKDNLDTLLSESTFIAVVDSRIYRKLNLIRKLGNVAVHSKSRISQYEALNALEILFEFIKWVDYTYGDDYEDRKFDAALIPKEKVVIDTQKLKEQESLIEQKDSEIHALQHQIALMSEQLTAEKKQKQESRSFTAAEPSDFESRKIYIDVDLKLMGWTLDGSGADVLAEYELDDLNGIAGQKGYADYVLMGRDGLPLAVIEAKRTVKDPADGQRQAELYADRLERKFGRRPMIFTTNGFETYFRDVQSTLPRKVSGVFTRSDLQKLTDRKGQQKKLTDIPINTKITDRAYQMEAVRAVCGRLEQGFRKALLVMATGTGKTRTAASLTDVLSRGGRVTNVLFLADRTALVKQAKDDFKNYLPDMSLCNLCSNKDDANARIVFSTYPTILNAIDSARTRDGEPLYSPAHFDMIIIDESHRSIFRKYRAIFEYFDAVLVGLTATPKTDVDRNTYDFFEMEDGIPTFAYDYETAVSTDCVLVPYYNYEVSLKFIEEGITYDDLSDDDKARYEDDFAEDGEIPDSVSAAMINRSVFNEDTVDTVLQDLMERGIKVEGGDRLGKTVIFAQNKAHAEFIVKRFDALYPRYNGKFAARVTCDDSNAQAIIDDFKQPNKMPVIAVSVDMMDTGIDVPECVNLVFFKKVRSKTKFWQMIGRGTRRCDDLRCTDQIDGEYIGKRRFLIFDYCGNFEFFRQNKNGYEAAETRTLTENIFGRQVRLKKEYVEKFKQKERFDALSGADESELIKHIAPLIVSADTDEYAKRFDNLMYGLMLSVIEGSAEAGQYKKQLCGQLSRLEGKANIPQVQKEMPLLEEVQTDSFWEKADVPELEAVRARLRGLMQFLEGDPVMKVITGLSDVITDSREGRTLDAAYDFEDYRRKVNRYIEEHKDEEAIYKLNHNLPLTKEDHTELERIFTEELGSSEDYRREYGDTPFSLLVRRIAKLDHESAMAAFAQFINDSSLGQDQIAFIRKIIAYIERNGYIEDAGILMRPPFDKPGSFVRMFDDGTRTAIIQVIDGIRRNAMPQTA